MKQKITVLMAFLIVMIILAGCGSSAGNNAESKTAAEEDTGELITHNGVVEAKPVTDGAQASAEENLKQEVPGSEVPGTGDASEESDISGTTDSGQTKLVDAEEESGQDPQDAVIGNSGQTVQDDAGNSGQEDGDQWNTEDDGWKKAYLQVMEDYRNGA